MDKLLEVLNQKSLSSILSRISTKTLLGLKCISTKTLLGLKCISKNWHSFISRDRSLIQALLEKTEPTLSGFIFQESFMWITENVRSVHYINIPLLDHNTRSKSIVHNDVFNFLPEDVIVLSSCNGLICCLNYSKMSSSSSSSTKTTLYICNPANKQWVCLDCPDYDKTDSIVLAFDPYKHPIDVSTKFNLVKVKQLETENEYEGDEEEPSHYFTFEIYSSETKSWKKLNEIYRCDDSLIKGTYSGGIMYWLTDSDQILTLDLENELSLVISKPVPSSKLSVTPATCIGEWKGMLHYVMITEQGIHVWHLEDGQEAKWQSKFWKSLEEIEEENSKLFNLKNSVSQRAGILRKPWMDPLSFKDGVLLMKVGGNVYFYDIEKNIVVESCNLGDVTNSLPCPRPNVLHYSMSLVPLE